MNEFKILIALDTMSRAGIEPTATQMSGMTGISVYRVRKLLTRLGVEGLVDRRMVAHRPNIKKSRYWLTGRGIRVIRAYVMGQEQEIERIQ